MGSTKRHIALVYEISNNPHFDPRVTTNSDSLLTLVRPSEIDRLIQAFKENGYSVEIVDGPQTLAERAPALKASCHFLFNKSIGFVGLERKSAVPAICYLHQLPLVGSGGYAMTLARHKFHTNRLLAGIGYSVPNAVLWRDDSDLSRLEALQYPVIVKPNQESDCLGITSASVVNSPLDAAEQARIVATKFRQPAIVEEIIPGEELRVPVIGNGKSTRAFGCVGVMRNGQPIVGSVLTWEDQLSDGLGYYQIPVSPIRKTLEETASNVHRDLNLRDYSRVDFRLDASGKPVCMEVSTHPELSIDCSFVRAASEILKGYNEIVNEILAAANVRMSSPIFDCA
jgi:D-alanine-D-alanine ligase